MYKAGGTYGAGQRAIATEQAQKGLAGEQAGLVATGMSSGSAAGAARGRYSRGLTTSLLNIEDVRTDKLSAALTAVAAAKEARGARLTGAYQTTAQLIQGFKEPTTSEYASQEDIAKMSQQTQNTSALLGYKANMAEIKARYPTKSFFDE